MSARSGARRAALRRLVVAALLGVASAAPAQERAVPPLPTRGLRLVVSLDDRKLWALLDADTLLTATVAVGSGATLEYAGRRWRFDTPVRAYHVLRKDSLPVWVPPDWHYYEAAEHAGLAVRRLSWDRAVALADGRRLAVRDRAVGVVSVDSGFVPLPADEEIVFDGALFIPPLGTTNREIAGELGRYRLALEDGISLHGTPHQASLGKAATHGCIRLADADVAWLYAFVPVGTPVYVY